MNSRARTQTILNANRCTRCLQEGHFNVQCKAENCRKCGGSHHTFLHYDNQNPSQGNAPNKFKLQQRNGQQPEVNFQPSMTAMAYNPGYPAKRLSAQSTLLLTTTIYASRTSHQEQGELVNQSHRKPAEPDLVPAPPRSSSGNNTPVNKRQTRFTSSPRRAPERGNFPF